MKPYGKKSAALVLALCLLLGLLSGCGKKANDQQLSANVYVPSYLDVDLNVDSVRGGCADSENIYLLGQVDHREKIEDPETGESYYNVNYTYQICRIPVDGGPAEMLPNYVSPSVPEGKEGNAYVEGLTVGADGTLWVQETVDVWGGSDLKYPGGIIMDDMLRSATAMAEDAPADVEEPADEDAPAEEPVDESWSVTVRRQLDSTGSELARIDMSNLEEKLTGMLEEGAYINNSSFDRDGNLYVTTETDVYVLDPQMNLLFTLEGEDMWYELIQLGDGRMGMQKWTYDETTETSTNTLRTIDPAAQDWGEEYLLPNNGYSFYPGGGDYLFYYQIADAIFGAKPGETREDGLTVLAGEKLFSWIEADINTDNVRFFNFLPDGRVAAVIQEWKEDKADVGAVVLTSTPREQLPEKTTLVYATLYLNYNVRNQIIAFNKKSDSYRIEVKDYSEIDSEGDGSAALQKLNTEILAGTIPDILDTNSLPVRIYGSRGILEDLWPYIEKDPDLGRDALMTRPLTANEQDGKLYEIFPRFSIRTAAGAREIVGDRMSWNLADLHEALARMPEGCSIFGQSDTRDDMLGMVLYQNMDSFVDWSTGKCSFDSDGFKSLLEFAGSFPAEFKWEDVDWDQWEEEEVRALNGRQLLLACSVSSFDYWSIQRLSSSFGGEFSYIGYPREDGRVGSSFTYSQGVAMTSSCRDKDGAWSFLRQTLLPAEDESVSYNFPINKADFDKMVEKALTPQYETDENGDPLLDENGEPVLMDLGEYWISADVKFKLHTTTQEEVDQVMALYNAVDSVFRYDEKIYDAVQEVAGSYFSGDKPLDDAASLIQSKVTLYVNESK